MFHTFIAYLSVNTCSFGSLIVFEILMLGFLQKGKASFRLFVETLSFELNLKELFKKRRTPSLKVDFGRLFREQSNLKLFENLPNLSQRIIFQNQL